MGTLRDGFRIWDICCCFFRSFGAILCVSRTRQCVPYRIHVRQGAAEEPARRKRCPFPLGNGPLGAIAPCLLFCVLLIRWVGDIPWDAGVVCSVRVLYLCQGVNPKRPAVGCFTTATLGEGVEENVAVIMQSCYRGDALQRHPPRAAGWARNVRRGVLLSQSTM